MAHPNAFVGVSKLPSPKTMFLPTVKIIFLVVQISGGRWAVAGPEQRFSRQHLDGCNGASPFSSGGFGIAW